MSNLLEEHVKGTVFVKRMLILIVFQLLLVTLLVIRLFYLQILNFNELRNKSESNRIKIDIIPPIRGNILDRNNNLLTINRKSYELILYKDKNKKDYVRNIGKILELKNEREQKIKKQLKNNRDKQVISLINNLTWEELAKISYNNHKMTNISIEEGYTRQYSYSKEFAHIIGYIAPPNEKEIKKLSKKIGKNILLHPNFKIGKNGLEAAFNSKLNGKSGYKKTEVNAFNIPIKEIEKVEPQKGDDLKLTIDLKLQQFIYSKIDKLRAAVVVLDVETGEILAIVSSPSFETNEFIDGISNNYWADLVNDDAKPLYNKTISALYAMGSTFKPVVAIAALENGWDENKKIDCKGIMKINNKLDFKCWRWKEGGHGKINIIEAIEQSCNIFFANLGVFVGVNNIYNTAQKLGIGEIFNIDLPEYNNGILPSPSWKKEYYNDSWTKGDTINMSIGQGYISANPLQLAVMISRIANGGYPIKPFLTYDNPLRDYNKNIYKVDPMFSNRTINIVKNGMFDVVNGKRGTVRWLRTKKSYKISGKTGTAQVISLEAKEKMEKELKDGEKLGMRFRNHGIFVGFAPFDKPKYGIAVVIEHGGSGSIAAAPVAIDILKYMIDNDI